MTRSIASSVVGFTRLGVLIAHDTVTGETPASSAMSAASPGWIALIGCSYFVWPWPLQVIHDLQCPLSVQLL
ncbi:hypothetical protein [Phyllobacterium brassicacearum]|uniref:hypothetical protein n=1 Tax=Phyllobacterium brassicacearum TaxID=314235 RepID=UPI001FDEB8DD|nr:hypothetical protein [Phyllobacterium brassicacearum]